MAETLKFISNVDVIGAERLVRRLIRESSKKLTIGLPKVSDSGKARGYTEASLLESGLVGIYEVMN